MGAKGGTMFRCSVCTIRVLISNCAPYRLLQGCCDYTTGVGY